MSGEQPPRVVPLPLSSASDAPPRHETVLPAQPPEALAALDAALASAQPWSALRATVARWPALLDGWARLGRLTWEAGDPVAAYAFARTGYHRGLDALRRHGWGGTGMVRWARESNRGFLRALHLLLVCSASIGEQDEAVRCRQFLLELDPEDGIGAAGIPENPPRDWRPERFL
ncbi:MAG: DUF3151 domain-containing protein [Chloroflexi bacterium]|nr:MAG: DUF3151 domain-containing protein [Chloroflexota bacterium]